jgi:hypothetical protein
MKRITAIFCFCMVAAALSGSPLHAAAALRQIASGSQLA